MCASGFRHLDSNSALKDKEAIARPTQDAGQVLKIKSLRSL